MSCADLDSNSVTHTVYHHLDECVALDRDPAYWVSVLGLTDDQILPEKNSTVPDFELRLAATHRILRLTERLLVRTLSVRQAQSPTWQVASFDVNSGCKAEGK